METVSETPFNIESNDEMMDTKTVSSFESLFANHVQKESGIASDGIIAAALKELKDEVDANKTESEQVVEEVPEKRLKASRKRRRKIGRLIRIMQAVPRVSRRLSLLYMHQRILADLTLTQIKMRPEVILL